MNNKSTIIQKMFNQIAKNYDLMNYIMSFGNHKRWEKEIIKSITKNNPKILDIACGTGSLTKEMIKLSTAANVVGLDFSLSMLEIAKKRQIENIVLADSHYIPTAKVVHPLISLSTKTPEEQKKLTDRPYHVDIDGSFLPLSHLLI